jgi:hypothetical protein
LSTVFVQSNRKDSILKSHDGSFDGMTEKHIRESIRRGEQTFSVAYEGNWWHIESADDYRQASDKYFWEVNFS